MIRVGNALYLDVCALSRPYDLLSIVRNEIEAAAVHLIISHTALGDYTMWHSPAHDVEIKRNPDSIIRSALKQVLEGLCRDIISRIDTSILKLRVMELINGGMRNLDALHVADAERINAAFITCDDQLLRKCRQKKLEIWYGNPIDFCRREGII